MNHALSSLFNGLTRLLLPVLAALSFAVPGASFADTVANSAIGARGYDLTTFFTSEKPARGTATSWARKAREHR